MNVAKWKVRLPENDCKRDLAFIYIYYYYYYHKRHLPLYRVLLCYLATATAKL